MSDKELYEKVLKYKKILDYIFYDKLFFGKDITKFNEYLKVKKINIQPSIIKFYYDNQAITQIFKPHREFYENEKNHFPIVSDHAFERVFVDSMYLTQKNSVLGFVNIMDLYSKYAYSHVFTIPKNTQNLKSEQTKIAFIEFQNIIKKFNYKIENVVSDLGSEYQGEFQKYLKEQGIHQYSADSGNKKVMSPIERFNGTLRLSLEKYNYLFHKLDNKELEPILHSYNNTYHESIDDTPNNILINHKSNNIDELNKIKIKNYNKEGVLHGYCRVLINKGIFKKLGKNWSDEVYKIKEFLPLRNLYLLDNDKYYPLENLQLVKKEYIMTPNITIERAVRNYGKYTIPEKEDIVTRSKGREINYV